MAFKYLLLAQDGVTCLGKALTTGGPGGVIRVIRPVTGDKPATHNEPISGPELHAAGDLSADAACYTNLVPSQKCKLIGPATMVSFCPHLFGHKLPAAIIRVTSKRCPSSPDSISSPGHIQAFVLVQHSITKLWDPSSLETILFCDIFIVAQSADQGWVSPSDPPLGHNT